jgi:hypothetical protein
MNNGDSAMKKILFALCFMLAAALPALAADSLCMSTVDVYDFANARNIVGVFGRYVVIATTYSDSITVLSLSDSGRLSYEGTIFDGMSIMETFKVSETQATSYLDDSLRLIDFTDPLDPVIIFNYGYTSRLWYGNNQFVINHTPTGCINFFDLRNGDSISYYGTSEVMSGALYNDYLIDYPYLIRCGWLPDTSDLGTYRRASFGVLDFSDPDSIYQKSIYCTAPHLSTRNL